jgi:hypothetical protein
MTQLDKVTGSPDRSTAVLVMVGEAIREGNPSFENAASKTGRYNNFGDLYDDEFQVALAMLQPAEFDPADVQVEPATAESAAVVEPVADQDAPAMSRDEANADLQRRKEALLAARKLRMIAEDDQRTAREAIAAAVLEWQAGGPSKDSIIRREIAAINRDRANKVEHGDQRRPGASRIDQEAFYGSGRDAGSYARKQLRNGWHRPTALTPGGTLQRPGVRGTKLPSEV